MKATLTVKVLRELLAELPDDMPIVVPAHEAGYNNADPRLLNIRPVLTDAAELSFFGTFEESEEGQAALAIEESDE